MMDESSFTYSSSYYKKKHELDKENRCEEAKARSNSQNDRTDVVCAFEIRGINEKEAPEKHISEKHSIDDDEVQSEPNDDDLPYLIY